jgi:putative nucleotidyltransferase with HDIG domain
MSEATAFLHALAQALSATALYGPSHPARRRAIAAAYDRLRILQAADAQPYFSFVGHEVIYGYDALRELKEWEWAEKCAAAGIQRIEVVADVTGEAFELFIDDIHARLGDHTAREAPPTQKAIRFGAVGVQVGGNGKHAASSTDLYDATGGYALKEEAETVRWIHGEVAGKGAIPMAEAEMIVRSLSIALHADGRLLIPLLRLKAFDQYTTTHSINVAILAMGLAEELQHVPRDVRAIGIAGLLHDLGKVRVPPEILTKPGELTPEEREILERHPAEGARMILNSDKTLGLQAAVAFEHHVMINGGGYPHRHFNRDCHYASTLVHVCDVFDALHTDRPYRPAWSSVDAVAYIERRSGTEFDPLIAEAFASMMRRNHDALGKVTEDEPVSVVRGIDLLPH